MEENRNGRPVWSAVMQRANHAFAARRFDEALAHYHRALGLVDELLDGSRLCAGLLMAKIVSHHNRANAHARAGRLSAAEDDYRAAYAFARCVADDVHLPQSLRQAACRHCRACMAEWQQFSASRDRARVDPGARAGEPAEAGDAAVPVVVH